MIESIEDRVIEQYFADEPNADQPAGGYEAETSADGHDYVVLSNVRGVLAVYRVDTDEITEVEEQADWPADLVKQHLDPETWDELFGGDLES